MTKQAKSRRICSKVTESDHKALMAIVRLYGFKSVYQLVQALILCFLRHVDSIRDEEYEDGMAVEIDEMFEDLERPQPRSCSYTTYQYHKGHGD